LLTSWAIGVHKITLKLEKMRPHHSPDGTANHRWEQFFALAYSAR